MTMKLPNFQAVAQGLRKAGPYLLIELLLPGGTLVALLLWLSQHKWAEAPQGPPFTAAAVVQAR